MVHLAGESDHRNHRGDAGERSLAKFGAEEALIVHGGFSRKRVSETVVICFANGVPNLKNGGNQPFLSFLENCELVPIANLWEILL